MRFAHLPLAGLLAAGSLAQQPAGDDAAAAPKPAIGRVGAVGLETLARHDDGVVVTVGEIELHRSDVFRQLDLASPGRSAEVIRQMIMTTAAQLDALREGVDVPLEQLDREIELAVAQQKASFALEVDEHMPLEEYLRVRHGLNAEQYRDEVRRMVLATLLLERVVRLDQLRTAGDTVGLLLVEDETLARDLMAQLTGGASFAVLARKHSRHPSAESGGELPPVPLAAKVPVLEGRESMQPGELLGPAPITLEGKTWWRILRLVGRSVANERPWSELRDTVEADLAARPITGEELAVFEARALDRYRVSRPLAKP